MSRVGHTVVLDQVAQVNAGLEHVQDLRRFSAQTLGLAGAEILVRHDGCYMPSAKPRPTTLLGSVTLRRIFCQGDPEFPYLFGEFSGTLPSTSVGGGVVALHTGALRQISLSLGLEGHRWGTQNEKESSVGR